MRARVSLLAVLALVAVFAAGLAVPNAAAATGYRAGAAAVVLTPPPITDDSHRVDCPGEWPGTRQYAFDEPYVDLNGNDRWDVAGSYGPAEPYCDANANGRYDGIWVVGGVDHKAFRTNDDIYVRTFVIGNGTTTVAVSSVDALGLFDTDVDAARSLVRQQHPEVADLFVSANHNESSPDTIGLWGPAPDESFPASTTSGVNDYYMDWVARRVALTVDLALDDMRPASLRVVETTAPGILPRFKQWPTTNAHDPASATPSPSTAGRIDVWNPKVHVLQAVSRSTGATIFTLTNYDAHIQNLGHSDEMGPEGVPWNRQITADWPAFFWRDVEAAQGGVAIFLAGTNGSIETPSVPSRGDFEEGDPRRSQAIGEELAAVTNAALGSAVTLPSGPVKAARDEFDVPLQNNLFAAAFAAGLFPHKHLEPAAPSGGRPQLRTQVGLVRIGPLELMANPGEAFLSLMKGSHWGRDEGCPSRANPPVPSWASTARYRWDMGLANDMIGYEIPAWGWDESPAVYSDPDDPCSQDESSEGGHDHALESESVGPDAGNLVAEHLTALVRSIDGTPSARILAGRYLFADGSVSRRPYRAPDSDEPVVDVTERAVGFVAVQPDGRKLVVALPGYSRIGRFNVGKHGTFVDFDAHRQPAGADQLTRGMKPTRGRVIFLDVWPNLSL